MTHNSTKPMFTSSLKNSPGFITLLNISSNIKMWVTLCVCFLNVNLRDKIYVQFQLVAELLFSSVLTSPMMKVLTFLQSSIKFMTPWAILHTNQQIPHARVSVTMDSKMMWLLLSPSMNWKPSIMRKWKPENTTRPWLELLSPLHYR